VTVAFKNSKNNRNQSKQEERNTQQYKRKKISSFPVFNHYLLSFILLSPSLRHLWPRFLFHFATNLRSVVGYIRCDQLEAVCLSDFLFVFFFGGEATVTAFSKKPRRTLVWLQQLLVSCKQVQVNLVYVPTECKFVFVCVGKV